MDSSRVRQPSIRHKLLAIALLPLLVALPLLGVILSVWGDDAFDRLLVTKIRSDLAVAHGYFERVLGEVGAGTARIAESHGIHLALATREPAALQTLLSQSKERSGLDFLNFRASDGSVLVTDWGVPGGAAQRDAAALSVNGDSASAAAPAGAHIEVLEASTLAALAPTLQSRVPVPLVPTQNAAPTTRTREDRAMVALAAHPVRAADGRLLGHVQGGVLLNRNLAFIDHINEIVYPEGSLPFGSRGTATLFLDDVRISTNVRLFQNERAIGTRVSHAVRDAVLERGSIWLGSAFVVNDWYMSGYQPIADGAGRRVGMLYVGFSERPFTLLKYAVLASLGLIFLAVMAGAAVVSLRLARGIFEPLEQMTRTMQSVEQGRLDARVGALASRDEVGRLAGHLDHLLDVIDENTRGLDRKVAERTQELSDSNASLRLAQQQLVKSEKLAAIGQLTASIAHEVNNPIAVIQGNLDLLRELLGEAAAGIQPELRLIDEQVERMRLIVTQLLQFARPTEYAGYVETLDVHKVLENCLVLVAHLLTRTHIDVQREFSATRSAGMNRSELQQVLINLMVNAIQAMPGGGTLCLRTGDWDGIGVAITIEDTGPGLGDDLLRDLFQPFVTTKKDGTGLGLWISRSLVERYGGDIRAGNAERGGAWFSVFVRSEPSEPSTAQAVGSGRESAAGAARVA